MNNFEEKITELGHVYEHAKDQLIRLTIKNGEHTYQTAVFEDLRKIRDIAAEALKAGNIYVPTAKKEEEKC